MDIGQRIKDIKREIKIKKGKAAAKRYEEQRCRVVSDNKPNNWEKVRKVGRNALPFALVALLAEAVYTNRDKIGQFGQKKEDPTESFAKNDFKITNLQSLQKLLKQAEAMGYDLADPIAPKDEFIVINKDICGTHCQESGVEYDINGKTYRVEEPTDDNSICLQECKISYYGEGDTFNGRHTATGGIFNKNWNTGAHRTLPLPALAMVINKNNGKWSWVIFNDRGPFVKEEERGGDVSAGVAEDLKFKGNGTTEAMIVYFPEESKVVRDYVKGKLSKTEAQEKLQSLIASMHIEIGLLKVFEGEEISLEEGVKIFNGCVKYYNNYCSKGNIESENAADLAAAAVYHWRGQGDTAYLVSCESDRIPCRPQNSR